MHLFNMNAITDVSSMKPRVQRNLVDKADSDQTAHLVATYYWNGLSHNTAHSRMIRNAKCKRWNGLWCQNTHLQTLQPGKDWSMCTSFQAESLLLMQGKWRIQCYFRCLANNLNRQKMKRLMKAKTVEDVFLTIQSKYNSNYSWTHSCVTF